MALIIKKLIQNDNLPGNHWLTAELPDEVVRDHLLAHPRNWSIVLIHYNDNFYRVRTDDQGDDFYNKGWWNGYESAINEAKCHPREEGEDLEAFIERITPHSPMGLIEYKLGYLRGADKALSLIRRDSK